LHDQGFGRPFLAICYQVEKSDQKTENL